QAEDGIRDFHVTGVQTCALPILGISDVPPDDVLALWYRAYVEVAYECLVDHGFPTNPPPSEATWIDNYPNVWTPHDIVGDQPDVIAVCPQDIGLLLIELGRRDSGGRLNQHDRRPASETHCHDSDRKLMMGCLHGGLRLEARLIIGGQPCRLPRQAVPLSRCRVGIVGSREAGWSRLGRFSMSVRRDADRPTTAVRRKCR